MCARVLGVIVGVLVALSLTLPAAAIPSAEDRGRSADTYLKRATALGRFNGAVLIAIDGKIVLDKGYGFADFQRRIPNTAVTEFEIASLSKMFTAFSILQLSDQGRLSLSDPICRYLQSCPASWDPITIDQVVHHRSGIPDYEDSLGLGSPAYLDFMAKPSSGERIMEREAALPLDFPPGSQFNYSNTGYVVLSMAAAQSAGESFGNFVRSSILEPAGMTHTGILGEDNPTALAQGYQDINPSWKKRVAGYDLAEESPQPFPSLSLEPPHGDADLFSTVGDLYRWTVLTQGSALVSLDDAHRIFRPEDGYGFGWFVDTEYGTAAYSHTGALPGYLGLIEIFPARHVTVIYLDNYWGTTGQVDRSLSAIALGEPYDMPFSANVKWLPPRTIQTFLGSYRLDDGDVVTVTKGRQVPLIVRNPNKYAFGLVAIGPDRFYLALHDGIVTFEKPQGGKSRRINLHYDGVDHRGVRQ